jgi:hypothetical protein
VSRASLLPGTAAALNDLGSNRNLNAGASEREMNLVIPRVSHAGATCPDAS